LGLIEYFAVATPVEPVVAESVAGAPVGFVMVTVTVAPETASEPSVTPTVTVAYRVFPLFVTNAEAVTFRLPRMLTEPEVLAASPVVLSVADALKPNEPVAPLGEINESVVDTLDPAGSDEEAGLKDEAHPLGTVAENIIGEGAQPAPLLLVTVIVYWNVELAGTL